MVRRLFIQEIVRGWPQPFAVFGATYLGLTLLQRLMEFFSTQPGESGDVVSAIATMWALLASCGAGTETFSRSFRQGPLKLLEVMPVSRAWIWAIRVVKYFTGAVVTLVAVLLARPQLLDQMTKPGGLLALGAWALLFTMGCCMSLLSNSTGGPFLASAAGSGVMTLLFSLIGFRLVPQPFLYQRIGLASPVSSISTGLLLAPLCLLLSFVIFMRGESEVPQRRLRSSALVVATLIGAVLLITASVDAGAFAIGSPWKTTELIEASLDRTYFSAVQFRGTTSPEFRVVVVEAATGKVAGTYTGISYVDHVWDSNNTLIVLSKGSTLRYLLRLGSVTLNASRVFPSEESREMFRLPGVEIETLQSSPLGPWMVTMKPRLNGVLYEHSVMRIESSGEPRELLKLPRAVNFVYFVDSVGDIGSVAVGSRWRIGKNVTELPRMVGYLALESKQATTQALAEMERGKPVSKGPGAPPGVYVQGEWLTNLNPSDWLFYLQQPDATGHATLLARRQKDTEWKEVTRDIPMTDGQSGLLAARMKKEGGLVVNEILPGLGMTRQGVVVHIRNQSLFMYDLNSGERFDLGMITDSSKAVGVVLSTRPDKSTVFRLNILGSQGLESVPATFLYISGAGAPLRIDAPSRNFRYRVSGRNRSALFASPSTDGEWKLYYTKPPEAPKELVLN